MIILLLLQIPALAFVNQIFIVLSLVLTILSLVDYVYKNHRVISEGGF
jgi:CDP-diacylglycerol--glycerol-3-phosphate 3-phosphatidyltransferase